MIGSEGAFEQLLTTRDGFELFDALQLVVATDDTPVPYASSLESAWLPTVERIAQAIRDTLAY